MSKMCIETGKFIVKNGASREKTCKKFAITKKMLSGRIAVLKQYDRELYNEIHDVLDNRGRRMNSLPLYLRVAEHVLNTGDSWYGTMEHFDITDKTLYDALRYIKAKNEPMYKRMYNYLYE